MNLFVLMFFYESVHINLSFLKKKLTLRLYWPFDVQYPFVQPTYCTLITKIKVSLVQSMCIQKVAHEKRQNVKY